MPSLEITLEDDARVLVDSPPGYEVFLCGGGSFWIDGTMKIVGTDLRFYYGEKLVGRFLLAEVQGYRTRESIP
jgi:hypothetical protein